MTRFFLLGLAVPALCCAASDPVDELETVVVTASPIGDPEFLATIAGSADRNALLRSGGASLAAALDWVPGVTGSGIAAGASRPVIRGLDANRVRTLEDGIGSFDVSDVGADHGVPLDPLAAERVEVVRGAATLRYGSQAIGGVVNAISSRVPQRRGDGLSGEITGGYDSVTDGTDASGQANLAAGSFALHGDAFIRRNGDYDTPAGRLDNSWVDTEGGALGATGFLGEGEDNRMGVGVVRHASRYGLPGEDAHIDMDQTKVLLRSAFVPGADATRMLTVDGGWANYSHSEIDEAGEVHSTFRNREWDLRGEMLLGAWRSFNETAIGAQLQDREFSALGEGADYMSPAQTRSKAVFGFSEARLGDWWRLQLGARVEDVDAAGTPISDVHTTRGFTPVSGSVGLVFGRGGPWRAGLSLSSAARAPAQTELFARGPHEGPGTFEIGDPGLDTERANSVELTLRWREGRLHADGALWVARFDGFVHGNLTGRTCDEAGDCVDGDGRELREMRYAQRGATFKGAEGHADIELARLGGGRLELALIGDIVRAEFSGDGGPVPRIPPWRLGAGISWEADRFDASLRYRYAGRQERVGAGDTVTPGYASLDAQFGWRPLGEDSGFEVALVGHNLTDSLQRNAVALNKDDVPQPGRNIRLLLRAGF